MITIDKAYFKDKDDFSWLGDKLDSSFKLVIGDKTKIIYGFNGIGKSSFCNCLKVYEISSNITFLDYETESQKYTGETIKISPYVHKIDKLSKETNELKDKIDFMSLSKKQGFTKANASKGPAFIKMYAKSIQSGKHPATILSDNSAYNSFLSRHTKTDPSGFLKLANSLETVSTSTSELENYKKDKLRELLLHLKEHVSDKNTCPVCDSYIEDIDTLLDSRIATLAASKSELVKTMEENNIPFDEATIDDYISLYRELSTDQNLLNDYIICGNDDIKHNELFLTICEINKKETEIASYTSKRIDKYNQIKNCEDRFKKDVSKYLKIDEKNICFDDLSYEINITLERDSKTYSTGERHILWFLVEIYSFLGSDSSTMILDDPASSLDLANLYKIAFEIVRNSLTNNKNIVVFTHSADLINAINSQHPDKFDVYYLEEYRQVIYCDEIVYKGQNIPNIIDTKHFAGKTPNIYGSLKERDYYGNSSPEHLVYHYSLTENRSVIDSTNLSNVMLIDLIDSYSGISKIDFYNDSFNKVLYLLALRVWLEKAMYNLIPASDNQRQIDYLSKDSIHEKIKIIKNNSGHYSSDLFSLNGIVSENITSKKVMLNQNAHYYSQVMPFAYAINLSLDDIDKEINEVKNIF